MADSPADPRDIEQLSAANQQPESPVQSVMRAFGGQFEDIRNQYGGLVSALGPLVNLAKAFIDRGEYTDAAGNVFKLPVGAWRNPQGLVNTWWDALDSRALEGVHSTLKREKDELVKKILTGYYKARGFSDAGIEQAISRPSVEKWIASGLLSLQGHGQALRQLTEALQQEGIGADKIDTTFDRGQQAKVNILTQLYRTATDLSAANPLQGATMAKHMQTLLETYQQGGFKDMLRKPGVFDSKGNFTNYGRALIDERMQALGRNMAMVKAATGLKDPVEAVRGLKALFGDRISIQLTDKDTGKALASFHAAAKSAGLSTIGGLQLLKAMKDLSGSSSLKHLTAMAAQKLGFDRLGLMGSTGDSKQWNKITTLAVANANAGSGMALAGAAAAALAAKYGKAAAWNLMDDVLRKGFRYRNGIIGEASKLLGRRLDANDVSALMWNPDAKEYRESGRALPAFVTNQAARYWNYVKSKSPWLARNAGHVLRETGSLDMDSINQYLDNHGIDAVSKGDLNRHLKSLAPHLDRDMDINSALSFIGVGSQIGQRQKLIENAMKRGEDSYAMAHLQGRSGLEGLLSEAMQPDPTFGSIIGGFTGVDKHLNASNVPATVTLPGSEQKFDAPDLTKTAPKLEAAPGMPKA
jgi:hypothetical protein